MMFGLIFDLVDPIGKHPIYVHVFPLMERNKWVLWQNVLQASETWNTIIFSCNENIIQTPNFFFENFLLAYSALEQHLFYSAPHPKWNMHK